LSYYEIHDVKTKKRERARFRKNNEYFNLDFKGKMNSNFRKKKLYGRGAQGVEYETYREKIEHGNPKTIYHIIGATENRELDSTEDNIMLILFLFA
jgi:hypothetical protein